MRLAGAIQAYLSIDGKWRQVHGGRPIPVGRWTHLAMTYDRQSRTVRTLKPKLSTWPRASMAAGVALPPPPPRRSSPLFAALPPSL